MEIKNSTLSRRGLLAGIPAAAAVTAAPAAAATFLAKPDPIFAIIEQHRQAIVAFSAARALSNGLHEEWNAQRDPRGIYLYEFPDSECDAERRPDGSIVMNLRKTDTMIPAFAEVPADIDRVDEKYITCDDLAAWKVNKMEEWERWAGRDNHALQAAYDARNSAYEHFTAATAEPNTMPTTLAGMAALLRAIAETYDCEGDENGDVWGGTLYDHNDRDEEGDFAGDPITDNAGLLMEILENLAATVLSIQA